MKEIRYTILYCVCENFRDSILLLFLRFRFRVPQHCLLLAVKILSYIFLIITLRSGLNGHMQTMIIDNTVLRNILKIDTLPYFSTLQCYIFATFWSGLLSVTGISFWIGSGSGSIPEHNVSFKFSYLNFYALEEYTWTPIFWYLIGR
jgi:hypothetical protein